MLVVGHDGRIVYRKAYGRRALFPRREAMTADTIFDLASLTKVIATTPSLMKLFEQGKFRLNDKITDYIPEFQGGRSDITIRNLFTHFSGLPPDLPLDPPGRATNTASAWPAPRPAGPPGVRFVYSDINFVLLGELVRRLSGQMVSDYARQNVFLPLGMKQTAFQPPAAWVPRIAPTERVPKNGPPLRGVVHDPTARYMGGVAGHAGVFSTAGDLARFAQMMLDGGETRWRPPLQPLTVRDFTEPQSPPGQPILRGLGWDIDSPLFRSPRRAVPHRLLRAHRFYRHFPLDRPVLEDLRDPAGQQRASPPEAAHPLRPSGHHRRRAGSRGVTLTGTTIPAAGVHREARNAAPTGLDTLVERHFQPFQRQAHRADHQPDRRGSRRPAQCGSHAASRHCRWPPCSRPSTALAAWKPRGNPGLPPTPPPASRFTASMETRRGPPPEMLRGLDALVFDIQDVGARFYTYETTMAYAWRPPPRRGIPFYVLDRPNPITGNHVEGPLLDAANTSFVGYFAGMPVRHGMTMGELARLFNAETRSAPTSPWSPWRTGGAATGSMPPACPGSIPRPTCAA